MGENATEKILGQNTLRDLEALRKGGVLKNFYLAGGTGAALQLFHRRSYDLDFFTAKPFNENLLTKKISRIGRFELDKKETGTVIGLFRATRISFFHYPYPLLRKPSPIASAAVAHLLDIACMKVDAISRRGSKKDFIDLHFIIQHGMTLQEIIHAFQKKYAGIHYNLIHIQKGLVYFADAERDKMPRMLKPVSWLKVKEFFRKEIRNLV